MLFFLKTLYKKFRNIFYKLKHINKNVIFLENSKINGSVILEGDNVIGINNILSNCSIGRGTYTSKNTDLSFVKIGRFCSIGSNVKNTRGRHPTSKFVSTHPAFFSTNLTAGFTFCKKQLFVELKFVDNEFLVKIGNDVWIGDNVTLLDGITIGDGVIIGANSLVNKDIPPYAIVVGSPAKIIKYRFDDSQISFLLKDEWWNRNWDWLQQNNLLFRDLDLFMNSLDS